MKHDDVPSSLKFKKMFFKSVTICHFFVRFSQVVLLKDIEELQSLIGDIPLPSDYSGTGISQKENSGKSCV